MSSSLPDHFQQSLHALGFDYIRQDRSRGVEIWLSQHRLPHLEIWLSPEEPHDVHEIMRAVHSAGARECREEVRHRYRQMLQTFGGSIAADPVLEHLTTEPSGNQELGTENQEPLSS